MPIDRVSSGFTPGQVYDSGSASETGSTAPVPTGQVGGLSPRAQSSNVVLPRRGLPPGASQEISGRVNEALGLLNAGGAAMLQQGVQDGFHALPPQYQSLAMQTARLTGFMTDSLASSVTMPFPDLAQRLQALSAASSQLVDASKLDVVSSLGQDPGQRAAALAPQLHQLKEVGRTAGAALANTPVAELRANKELVKEQLTAWAGSTETLHEQLKAQFGETHPATVTALEARTEASAAYCKTMLRMAVANLGSMAFNMTVGPAMASLGRLFGAGN
jgi:hypothetical protein